MSENQDTINISDDDDSRNDVRREPSRFEPSVEPKQIERSTFKSVRDYFGEDEAVYIMDAKTTGNIGRYLNVGKKISQHLIFFYHYLKKNHLWISEFFKTSRKYLHLNRFDIFLSMNYEFLI